MPLKLNAGDTGYYRVQYSDADRRALSAAFDELRAADQLNLLSDTWALVKAGRATSGDYLSLAQKVQPQSNVALWTQVIDALGNLDELQLGKPGRSAFQAYGRKLLQPLYERLGWQAQPAEPQTDALLRNDVLTTLGDFGDEPVIVEAQRRFASFLKAPESLSGNLRPAVLHIVGRYADQQTYDQLHNLGLKATGTEEKNQFYGAMAAALDPKLAQQTLALSLGDELEPGAASNLVRRVADVGEHPQLAWEFLKANLQPLLAKQAFFSRYTYVANVANNFNDDAHAQELLDFARTSLPPEAMIEIKKIAERIAFRDELQQRELPKIDAWSCKQTLGSGTANASFCVGVQ